MTALTGSVRSVARGAPLLGTMVFIALGLVVPTAIIGLTPTTSRSAWMGILIIVVLSAARFAWTVSGASRRLFEGERRKPPPVRDGDLPLRLRLPRHRSTRAAENRRYAGNDAGFRLILRQPVGPGCPSRVLWDVAPIDSNVIQFRPRRIC